MPRTRRAEVSMSDVADCCHWSAELERRELVAVTRVARAKDSLPAQQRTDAVGHERSPSVPRGRTSEQTLIYLTAKGTGSPTSSNASAKRD